MPNTTIHDIAERCEVRMIGYRKSKDGEVVLFVLHPNEVPKCIRDRPVGTRYALAIVELNDDETPKEVMPAENQRPIRPIDTTPAPAPHEPGRARKRFGLAQQAGKCCADPVFRRFLTEEIGYAPETNEDAAEAVRELCDVESRKDIAPGTEAADIWRNLHGRFVAWKEIA